MGEKKRAEGSRDWSLREGGWAEVRRVLLLLLKLLFDEPRVLPEAVRASSEMVLVSAAGAL